MIDPGHHSSIRAPSSHLSLHGLSTLPTVRSDLILTARLRAVDALAALPLGSEPAKTPSASTNPGIGGASTPFLSRPV